MIIPPEKLATESLRGIVESFIIRDATDYGHRELDLDEKVNRLLPQVISGEVVIVYDETTESVNLIPKADSAEIA